MTAERPQHTRRDLFPLRFRRDEPDAAIPNKCIWKCNAACFHPAPNEGAARDTLQEMIRTRVSRRTLIKGAAAATVPLVLAGTPAGQLLLGDSPLTAHTARAAGVVPGASLGFGGIALDDNDQDRLRVPAGYTSKVLLRWGDPIHAGGTRMTISNASAALQRETFGYNCDFPGYFALQTSEQGEAVRGVMAVNHEYTEGARMFESYDPEQPTREQVDTELAAHGMTIVELRKQGGEWEVDLRSRLNRRITAETEIRLSGPLAGDERLRTSEDRRGTTVRGMLNNCAGGKTPWGTVLTAEENWHQYFANNDLLPEGSAQRELNARYGVPRGASQRLWEQHHERFDVSKEPNEINRFGYIVEIDPQDPDFVPRKRTAMGRFKHEAATPSIAASGRVAFYSGDDERFEYLYKFVTARPFNPRSRRANRDLLDRGTLYVAQFSEDGTGRWLALEGGRGALADWSQADVLLDTRGAADALGATPMDRPEDVEANPRNGRVYVALTNNTAREPGDENGPNPRPENTFGHVLEISEGNGDAASEHFTWEVFLLCGDPEDESTFFAGYDKSQVSAIACPDNFAFDGVGNLWIATDGQGGTIRKNDTVFAVPTAGPDRGKVQAFLTVPAGAEVCGPEFTNDYEALFANVQHPGEDSEGPDNAQSLWPDGTWPPLPSLVVVTKQGGGRIGS